MRIMDGLQLLMLLLGVALGAAFGMLATKSRLATAVAARDAAVASRESLAAERAADRAAAEQTRANLEQRLAEAERSLRQAEATQAELRTSLDHQQRATEEKLRLLDEAREQLARHFKALSAEALEASNRAFLELAETRLTQAGVRASGELEQRKQAIEQLVRPLRETLTKVEGQLRELEQARVDAYARLTEQVGQARESSERLRAETAALVTALRAPQARGRWGELQLRRVVELAGMDEHCDFDEQVTVNGADGSPQRPDLVVRIAGGKQVVVDAKVSLAAYLEAAESADEQHRIDRLRAHARHLKTHVDTLADKKYWQVLQPTPEFVVLFVPGEAFLAPALEHEPALLEYAMSRRVIIATPTTLVSMLRTIAYAWQQEALADNAREVFELGRELYDRLSKLGEHIDKLGRSITRVVNDYNTAVGSLEGRVLVSARKLKELKVVESTIEAPGPVEATTRPVTAPELVTAAAESRTVRALRPGEVIKGEIVTDESLLASEVDEDSATRADQAVAR